MQVPLIGAGVKSKSAVVNAQRRLNAYLEPQYDQDKSKIAVFGSPGLVKVLEQGALIYRGGVTVGDLLYLVQGNVFEEVNNAFVTTDLNSASRLTTTMGKVYLATNELLIGIVDGSNMYSYDIATATFTQVASSLFANPAAITHQDGYWLASFDVSGTNKKRCQISPDGVNWAALDFRAIDTIAGVLVRPYSFNGEVHQFGDKGIEFWAYTGDPTFPFQPIRGASLNVGLASRASIGEGAAALYFLGRRAGKGEVGVFKLVGHQAVSITTPDMANIFNSYGTKGDAVGYCVTVDEHEFYRISFPTAGKTWEYDDYASSLLGVPVWGELQSNNGRHFGELGFSLVEKTYVSDYRSGKLHRIDKEVYTDDGVEIAWELDTRHFFKDYDRVTVDELIADFETGVGINGVGQGDDPQVMLKVSRDGGRTWGAEIWVPLGAAGAYETRVAEGPWGTSRDFVFKLRITDPVKRVLTGLGLRASAEQVQQVA